MKISFTKIIDSIAPHQMEAYLNISGWILVENVNNTFNLWRQKGNDNFEIIQPTSHTMRSYSQRVYESLELLATVEARPIDLVIEDILSSNIDQVKIRVIHLDVSQGTIPLDDGVLLVEKGKELMIASTLSTFQKKRYYSGTRSVDAQKFIDDLRLGQTEVGSYIVNIIAPLNESLINDQAFENKSLSRAVLTNLSRSLVALESVVQKYISTEQITVFETAINDGVSANLCDALIGISGQSKNRDFSISLKLGLNERDEQNIKLNHHFIFSQIPIIEKASEYFKGNYLISNYEVSGPVVRMDHEPSEGFGVIKVNATLMDGQKNVSIQLDIESYWAAHGAHKAGEIVVCKGDLYVSPRAANLLNPTGFKVIGTKDLFN